MTSPPKCPSFGGGVQPTAHLISADAIGMGVAILLTVCSWGMLAHGFALGEYLPFWFWHPTTTPRPHWWLVFPILTVSVCAVYFIKKSTLPTWTNLLLLILLGFTVQHAFALMEGRGINGMRDRMVYTGHSGFVTEAVKQSDMLHVARHYQELIEDGSLSRYPNVTKPPGQLLFYMATHRIARALTWSKGSQAHNMTTFASFFWPLISYLCIVPLYFLSILCLEGKKAYVPPLLYLSVPNVTLITLHLDQCLYPFLFTVPIALLAHGLRLRKLSMLFGSGIMTSIAVYFSFSLVALGPYLVLFLVLGTVLGPSWQGPRHGWNRQALADSAIHLGCYISGVLVMQAALFFLLNYNAVENYSFAMSAHQAWKIKDWTLLAVGYVGGLDILEYVIWSGCTLSWLAAVYMVKSCRRLLGGVEMCAVAAVAFIPLLLGLAFASKTIAETARLWLFLTPLCTLFAARELVMLCGRWPWLGTASLVVL
ncbi:MAG: hypothetical protein ACYST0_09045, partial [Planctomycetota bacterium]